MITELFMILIIITLYLLAIMPRMFNRADTAPFKGVYYAHRGFHDNLSSAPENSMAAFKKAVALNYGIELDVQLTKDKIPVVFHDYTLNRICGTTGRVCEHTYTELNKLRLLQSEETIPRLSDVLEEVAGLVPLIIEYKAKGADVSVCAHCDALLSDYTGSYCVESFNPLVVYWFKKNRPHVMRGQLSKNYFKYGSGNDRTPLYWLLQNLLTNCITRPDFIAYDHHSRFCLSKYLCRHLYHMLIVAWTIKSQNELDNARKSNDLFIFEGFIPNAK